MSTEGLDQKTNSGSEEVSLKDILLKLKEYYRYLLSKWAIILVFGLLGGVLGFFYAQSKKTLYKATTTFVLEGNESSGLLGSYAGLASIVGLDNGSNSGGLFQSDNILELYKSRTMIEKTLLTEITIHNKSKLLIDHYIDFNNLRETWAKSPELKNIQFIPRTKSEPEFSRLQDSVVGTIVADIGKNCLKLGKVENKSGIIEVEVVAKDEFFAKAFNDLIVKNVNDFYIQTKTKKSLDNINILQQKTDSVRLNMNGAIYTSAAIADATPNLNPTRQVQRAAPMQRSQFNAETSKEILGELIKNLEMSKMALLKETPLIQVVDHPIFPLQKERLGKTKGIVVGGIIFGFFAVLILIVRKMLRQILAA